MPNNIQIKTILLITFILITPNTLMAQRTVTLDEVIAMAKANSPRLKSAAAAVERSRAARGEVWELGATTFDYSWGQLNSPIRNDRAFGVTQPLGSFITPFYQNSLAQHQINTGSHYFNMVEKEIVAEAKRAYAYYQYARHIKQMLSEQSSLAELLSHTGDLRHQQGDITLLEKTMTAAQAASMRNKVFQAEEEFKVAAARLQWVCFSDAPLVPADTLFVRFNVNAADSRLAPEYASYFNSMVSESEAMIKIERSRFFPELSAGYQRQNILPDRGLDSWTIGASVPLIFNAQRSRVLQARIDAEISRYDAQDNIRQLNNRIEELKAELRKHDESIRFFENSALPEANALIQAAQLQLQHSETNIAEFIQSINAALDIKQAYIEIIFQYNIAALEYELYNN